MNAFVWIASVFAILGVSVNNLFQFWASASFGQKSSLILGLGAGLAWLIVDLRTWWKARAKRYKVTESVNSYMLRLFNRGGSLAIFANNLSWIRTSPKILSFLQKRAGEGLDIRVFVPHHNDLTKDLSSAGVRVLTYPALAYEPEARFTLLNPDEPGSSLLAIGKGAFPDFYIEEFSDATHSRVIAVARDLLHIVERIAKNGNA